MTLSFFRQYHLAALFLLIVAAVIEVPVARAQNLSYKQFTSKDGLLSDKVYNMYEDHAGYVWVFSEFGTVKYNGETFKQVLKNLPPSESFIFSIYERKDGRTWIANSSANIYEVINDSAVKVQGIQDVSDLLKKSVSEIVKLVVDEKDNIWISTKNYAFKFILKNGKYTAENLLPKDDGDSVKIKLYHVDGQVVPAFHRMATDEFLSRYTTSQRYFSFDDSRRRVRLFYDAYTIPFRHFRNYRNAIYYSKADKIGIIDASEQVHEISLGAPVLNFNLDSANHLWVGCLNGGLIELDDQNNIVSRYLEGITVHDVLVDFQNGIWASTDGFGLFRFPNKQEEEGRNHAGLAQPLSFIAHCDTGIIVGNKKGELFIRTQAAVYNFGGNLSQPPVSVLVKKGEVIVATISSLEKFKYDKKWTRTTLLGKSAKLSSLYCLKGDTTVAVWRRGLMFIVGNIVEKSIDFGSKITCSAFCRDTLWLSTEDGFYYRVPKYSQKSKRVAHEALAEKEELTAVSWSRPLQDKLVSCINFDEHGCCWIGTRGAEIFLREHNGTYFFNTDRCPPCAIINSIEITGDEILVASNNGAFMTSVQKLKRGHPEWKKIFDGEVQKALRFSNFYFLNTQKGLVRIDADRLLNTGDKVIFRFAGLKHDSTVTVPGAEILSIPHRQQNLNFLFERISFTGNLPPITYTLAGPVGQSGKVNSSSLLFSRLIPGTYTLLAVPETVRGIESSASVIFQVMPEWYETTVARLTGFVVMLGMILLAISVYIRRSRRRIQERNKQEQLIIEYKLIALKAQVNPHFISNCLTAIQNLIAKGDNKGANLYVARFGLLVRKILDYSGKSFISLKEELQLVELYVDLEFIRFGQKFRFDLSVEESVNTADVLVPPLLLNPIAENAIWHGILPLKQEKTGVLTINVRDGDELILIEITDNGVGLKSTETDKLRKSYGLELTEQRIKNLNYLLNSDKGKFELQNLNDASTGASGVKVSLTLPVEKNE